MKGRSPHIKGDYLVLKIGPICGTFGESGPLRAAKQPSLTRIFRAVGTMHAGVEFSVLGPVRLHKQGVEAGAGQPRQCAVLASLLLRAGRPVSLSKLVEDVWGDDAPPSAVGSVRTYVYRLRQALGEQSDSSVSLVDGGYLLRIQPDALDLNKFKETTARAREARSTGDLASAASLLTEGLEMWKGVALAGVPGPFAGQQRSVLGELRLACAEEQLACEVERGRYTEAAAELSALLVEHPRRERICGLLMKRADTARRLQQACLGPERGSNRENNAFPTGIRHQQPAREPRSAPCEIRAGSPPASPHPLRRRLAHDPPRSRR